jgi:lipopolysaccharide/colanic/teichoic acid biosynthesis glycosyltransferase
MRAQRSPARSGYALLARARDILVAGVLLVLLSPLILAVAIAVWAGMGRPVLFRQVRAGVNGQPFRMLKFRTMLEATGPDGRPLDDAERLTRLGEFLRTWSLDELPQLANVLRGDMSLVGPRPLYLDYVPLYSPQQARRLLVRPGITGLAQVRGRNGLSWEDKFAYDTFYVGNRSTLGDMKILALTAVRVVQRGGVSADGHATAPWFTGSPSAEALPAMQGAHRTLEEGER